MSTSIIRIAVAISLVSFSSLSWADFAGNLQIQKLFGNSKILFGVNTPPPSTCDYFGRQFQFDATTEGGKNMLSILLAARMSGESIDIWYTPSSTPNTTEDTGCNPNNSIAVLTQVGFSK